MWNRLGASQPNAMVYALARDVVPTDYDPSINPKTGMRDGQDVSTPALQHVQAGLRSAAGG